jgi:phytoene desaturase
MSGERYDVLIIGSGVGGLTCAGLVAEGAFFGLELNGTNLGPFRPNYRSRLVGDLYLTGQCTKPGGGVPLVMTSGIIASSLLLNDWRKY